MPAEQQSAGGLSESTLDARLDAIDQILLGCIPRSERLAIIATVEEKLRGHCNGPAGQLTPDSRLATSLSGGPLAETMPYPAAARPLPGGLQFSIWKAPERSRLRRSKLAVASGILGIAAGALLFGTPVAYGLAAFLAELLDETIAIIMLVAYAVLIVFASGGAILAGLAALWRLRKRKEVSGKGWALTGLCTGPIPLGLTTLIGIYIGIQTIDLSSYFGSGSETSPPVSAAAVQGTASPYAVPASSVSLPGPLPPVDPGTSVQLASEPPPTAPVPVELLPAPATMPPATAERRPEPVAAPQPEQPGAQAPDSSSGLVE
jgi:hypothetical protein